MRSVNRFRLSFNRQAHIGSIPAHSSKPHRSLLPHAAFAPARRLARPVAAALTALTLAACSTMSGPAADGDSSQPADRIAAAPIEAAGATAAAELARPAEAAPRVTGGNDWTPTVLPGSPLTPAAEESVADSIADQDLWARIIRGFAMPELRTPLVAQQEAFYLKRPDYLSRMFDRGSRYLHHIVEEIEKRGMPTELALLPFVESAMVPTALSSAQAAGLWQFIPSTGKQYDLSQNWWVDNRRDVVQSTRAALDYLQYVYELNGNDWFLALASYNWGEGSVGRAVKRNRERGLPADYLNLRMPTETRHYVPKLIALKHILLRAESLNIALPELPNRPYFVTIEKTRPIDLKLAAQFAGMSVADFVALNPAHNRPVVSATANNVLKIPADRVDRFLAAMARHEKASGVFASWQPYTLKPGETLADVAQRANVSAAEVLSANGIAAGTRVLPGSRILTPQSAIVDEMQVEEFKGPRIYQLVDVKTRHHRVRRGDTVAGIARRYGLTPAQLRAMNSRIDSMRPGTSLLVQRASTQTIVTTETGERRVVRDQQPAVIQASTRAASSAGPVRAAPARATPARATPPAKRPPPRTAVTPNKVSNKADRAATPRKAAIQQPTRSASAAGRAS